MKDYEQIKLDYLIYERIKQTVIEFAQEYLDEFEQYGDNRLESAWIDGDYIEIEWVDHQYLEQGSTYLTNNTRISVAYLWNPDWKVDLHDERFRENVELMRQREARLNAEAESERDTRYELYQKLKNEFFESEFDKLAKKLKQEVAS